jgi:hypothetical protein
MSPPRPHRKIGAWIAGLIVLASVTLWISRQFFRSSLPPSPRTVTEVLRWLEPTAGQRLKQKFRSAGVSFPPDRLQLVAFKRERILEIYAGSGNAPLTLVCRYDIHGASGTEGPKLREGDRQVPEGLYAIELLNPNSKFHLSLRVNYPSAQDLLRAGNDGRGGTNLGGDIMIHGGSASAGCLAMGDPAIEEIFFLAGNVPLNQIRLLIAPCDLRFHKAGVSDSSPVWTADLHGEILRELQRLTPR